MNELLKKPHFVFLISVPIVILAGLLSRGATTNFNTLDTYFIISYWHLSVLMAMFLLFVGVVYWLMHKANRKLLRWLNQTHIGLTFGGTLLILIMAQLYKEGIQQYQFNNNLTLTILILMCIIILGQLAFTFNLIYALIYTKSK